MLRFFLRTTNIVKEKDYWNLEKMSHRLRVANIPSQEYALTGKAVLSRNSVIPKDCDYLKGRFC